MPTTKLPVEPMEDCLRVSGAVPQNAADRATKNGVLRGFVVAQLGHFKTKGRGQFTEESLAEIVKIGNAAPNGLKSRFTHPNLSNDGAGSNLGRAHNFFLDKTADGTPAVRADLHFAKYAEKSPRGNLSEYVMAVADEDPDSLSSSLVVTEKKEIRIKDEHGQLKEGEPPIWIPTALRATDIVDTGDAVDGLLSADEQNVLQDAGVRNATKMLDMLFVGQDQGAIRNRCYGFVDSYLTNRFGEEEEDLSDKEEAEDMADNPKKEEADGRLSALESQVSELSSNLSSLTEMLTAEAEERKKEREQLKAKADRAKAIQDKGALGHASAEQVSKWIADESLSADDVHKAILEDKFERAKSLSTDGSGDQPEKDTPEKLAEKQFASRGKDGAPRVINKDLTAEDYALSAAIDAGQVGVLDIVKEG